MNLILNLEWVGPNPNDQQAAVPVVQILNLLYPRTHLEVTSLANGWGNLHGMHEDARFENF